MVRLLSRPVRWRSSRCVVGRGRRLRGARRGSTLLEVVLAAVLLVMVTGVVFSTLTQMYRADTHRRKRLAAYELAGRLLLQYMDSPGDMPPQAQAYDDGNFRFRYRLTGDPVTFEVAGERAVPALDTTKLLHVKVFDALDRRVGGSEEGQQLAELVRFYSPFLILNGKDETRDKNVTSQEFLRAIQESARAGGATSTRGGGGK